MMITGDLNLAAWDIRFARCERPAVAGGCVMNSLENRY